MNTRLSLILPILLLAPLTVPVGAAPDPSGSQVVAASGSGAVPPASPANLLTNPGFEQGLQDWRLKSKTDPQSLLSKSDTHSGQIALHLHIANDTHWYDPGLDLVQYLGGLKPNTWYELSLWSKTANATSVQFGVDFPRGESGELPKNSAAWQRSKVRFKTNEKETSKWIYLMSWRRAEDMLIDDVAVVEANAPHGVMYPPGVTPNEAALAPGFHLAPGFYNPDSYEKEEDITGTLTLPAKASGVLTLLAKDGSGQETALSSVSLPGGSENPVPTVSFFIPAQLIDHEGVVAAVRLEGVAEPVATIPIRRRDLTDMFPEMTQRMLARLTDLKQQATTAGVAENAYVKMGLFIAADYVRRVQRPDIQKVQMDYWTWVQLREVATVLDATAVLIRQPLPDVPPIPFDHPRIDRGVFVAGSPPTPIFYGGYMGIHKDEDTLKLPGMGASDTVIEGGPNRLPANGKDEWHSARDFLLGNFERANAVKAKADMLLSPHFFPDWARQEAPDMVKDLQGGDFIIINHPVARKAIGQWLQFAATTLKDAPALLSFNLANEPGYSHSGKDPYTRPLWIDYLKTRHGKIENLNTLYGTSYPGFEQVPVPPGEFSRSDKIGERCAFYDWFHFNALNFSDWMRWMNGTLKQIAPAIYTQVKLSSPLWDADGLGEGVDHEDISHITDLTGCDGGMGPGDPNPNNKAGWAFTWYLGELQYDILRSFRHQPVANSENHIINDGYQPQVPMDYLRSAMWQMALHGQGETAIWEFGDANRGGDGGIKLRPADVFGAGRAWLDARRCASIVAAVVRATPHIAILYSRDSLYWQKKDASYTKQMKYAYMALSLLGEPVTFVTERELVEGSADPVQVILLPQANNVIDATVAALEKFVAKGGKLITLGEGNLGGDEYNRPRRVPPALASILLPASANEHVLFGQLAPLVHTLGGPPELQDAQTGARVYGVEYRVVSDAGHTYLSALNLLKKVQEVKLAGATQPQVKDLLSGNRYAGAHLQLEPMVPVLLDLGAETGNH